MENKEYLEFLRDDIVIYKPKFTLEKPKDN